VKYSICFPLPEGGKGVRPLFLLKGNIPFNPYASDSEIIV